MFGSNSQSLLSFFSVCSIQVIVTSLFSERKLWLPSSSLLWQRLPQADMDPCSVAWCPAWLSTWPTLVSTQRNSERKWFLEVSLLALRNRSNKNETYHNQLTRLLMQSVVKFLQSSKHFLNLHSKKALQRLPKQPACLTYSLQWALITYRSNPFEA